MYCEILNYFGLGEWWFIWTMQVYAHFMRTKLWWFRLKLNCGHANFWCSSLICMTKGISKLSFLLRPSNMSLLFLASNLGNLVELKDGSKNIVQQTQQQIHGIQAQLQPQHQSTLRLPQQVHDLSWITNVFHIWTLHILKIAWTNLLMIIGEAADLKTNASTNAADGSSTKFGFSADGENAKAATIHPSPCNGYGQGKTNGTSEDWKPTRFANGWKCLQFHPVQTPAVAVPTATTCCNVKSPSTI